MLAFYFALKPKTSQTASYINVQDMVLLEGESQQVDFSVVEHATVEFSVVDNTYAFLTNNSIVTAIKEGVTFLKAKVTYNGNTYNSISQIKVVKKNATENKSQIFYKFADMHNCFYSADVLQVKDVAVFSLILSYDQNFSSPLEYSCVMQITSNIKLTRELNIFVIEADGQGEVCLLFENLNFSLKFYVQLIK